MTTETQKIIKILNAVGITNDPYTDALNLGVSKKVAKKIAEAMDYTIPSGYYPPHTGYTVG